MSGETFSLELDEMRRLPSGVASGASPVSAGAVAVHNRGGRHDRAGQVKPAAATRPEFTEGIMRHMFDRKRDTKSEPKTYTVKLRTGDEVTVTGSLLAAQVLSSSRHSGR